MNYKEIKEKYPKAWQKLIKFTRCDTIENNTLVYSNEYNYDYEEFNERDLYDFFDENRIEVYPHFSGVTIHHLDKFITDEITTKGTRKEKENRGFECAFEILESKI